MLTRFRTPIIFFVVLLLLFAGAEILTRALGFGAFPVYEISNDLKYIPAANQHGSFMNRNRWEFNDRHMGDPVDWNPDKHPNILLIGNSIVMGGLPYDREDKLGPLLEKALSGTYTVWSIAAGGWTNVNEMAYLDKNMDVVRNSDIVVVEYMNGGLSSATPWLGETVMPEHKPLLASWHTLQKYVLPMITGKKPANNSEPLPTVGPADPTQVARFTQFIEDTAKKSRVFIFLYPDARDFLNKQHWREATAPVVGICKSASVTCIDIAEQPDWSLNLYNGGTHPTVEGNKVLARVLAQSILVPNATKKM